MIALRNLEQSYSHGVSKTFVLRQIDIDVKEGEFLSIMGPSGAGKSTLLHILGMHDSAWSGEFEFHGYAVHAMKPKERAKLHKQYIGCVSELPLARRPDGLRKPGDPALIPQRQPLRARLDRLRLP